MLSEFAENRVMVDKEDAFWGLVDSHDLGADFYSGQHECDPPYSTKTFSVSSKSRSQHHAEQTALPDDTNGLKVYLGEMKEEGCMSDIGGVLWEASVLLCCFILSHQQAFITASVLELGAGVGLPGLLLATLKRRHLDHFETTPSSSPSHEQRVGSVFLTDYDNDVLDNLVRNIHHQFRPTHDVCFQLASNLFFSGHKKGSDGVRIAVKQLDWTDDVYTLGVKDADAMVTTSSRNIGMKSDYEVKPVHDILMGSELIYMSSLVSLANVIL